MIIIILGGIGSGKTLSVVKEIIDKRRYAITNFNLLNMKNYHRIKISDIIIESEKIKDYSVNWDFWAKTRKKYKNYSIFLDEVHNLIHSRRSMSRLNILMSQWVSQIRKILSDSPVNHLYLISQTMRKIDVDFRELAQIIIECEKYEYKGTVIILQKWYDGFSNWENNKATFKKSFIANPYFKYYDSNELVTFEDAEDFV